MKPLGAGRAKLNRLLWLAVKKLPAQEETLRDLVVAIHEEERTLPLGGHTRESTRGLTDDQFNRLVSRVVNLVGRPRPAPRRPRADPAAPPATHLATDGERAQVNELAAQLGWSVESRDKFVRRQTGGRGIRTHRDATAVLAPMKRMLGTRRRA